MRDWARLYQTPLWLTAAFIGLLALFAVTPDPSRNAPDAGADTASEPTPRAGECVVCGIDQQCDPSSGRCMLVKHTPLPCVKTAEFDERAGFCLPTGAPTPVPLPEPDPEPTGEEPFEQEPRRDRTERDERDRQTAQPFEEDDRDRFEETPEPEPTD